MKMQTTLKWIRRERKTKMVRDMPFRTNDTPFLSLTDSYTTENISDLL
jgi:hypothetical protein